MTTPDAATVAAVLAEHHAALSPLNDGLEGWYWTCTCGARETTGKRYTNRAASLLMDAHVAAALLMSEPIAQALAAVEAVARVEALADEWVTFDCVALPEAVPSTVDVPDDFERGVNDCGAAIRAALRPEGGNQ
jgi:hypothetical protein